MNLLVPWPHGFDHVKIERSGDTQSPNGLINFQRAHGFGRPSIINSVFWSDRGLLASQWLTISPTPFWKSYGRGWFRDTILGGTVPSFAQVAFLAISLFMASGTHRLQSIVSKQRSWPGHRNFSSAFGGRLEFFWLRLRHIRLLGCSLHILGVGSGRAAFRCAAMWPRRYAHWLCARAV